MKFPFHVYKTEFLCNIVYVNVSFHISFLLSHHTLISLIAFVKTNQIRIFYSFTLSCLPLKNKTISSCWKKMLLLLNYCNWGNVTLYTSVIIFFFSFYQWKLETFLQICEGKFVNGDTMIVDGGLWLSRPRHLAKEAVKQVSRSVENRSRNASVSVPKSKL